MGLPTRQRFTFDEYLLREEIAEVKHEFLNGEVWAMAGGSPEHASVIGNVITLLNVQLRSQRCRVHSTELRVRVKATGWGPIRTSPSSAAVSSRIPTNPRVLVEVLSPSTEDYDPGEKLSHYQRIPSLEEVVLMAHDRHEIEVVRREADGTWSRHIVGAGQAARLASLTCELAVAEVYRDPLAAG